MNHFDSQDRKRQQRLYANLRWYLKNQVLLELWAAENDVDARHLILAFDAVSATLAVSKVDSFNDRVECYRATLTPIDTDIATQDLRDIVDTF